MRIGIAYDLKSAVADACAARARGEDAAAVPEDRFEEYDSLETVHAIQEALRAEGHEASLLGGGRALVEALLARPPELVFNIAEGWGTRSREAHVPAVCEMLGVPVTHSDPLTLALSLDKAMTKQVVAAHGVPTPRYLVAQTPADLERVELRFPVIAKPLAEGSSMGVRRHSRVTSASALREHCEWLWRDYEQPVLVEEFCAGPEFTVGVLGTGPRARVLGVMEIVPKRAERQDFVYSLEVKRDWQNEVEYEVPPRRGGAAADAVARVALDAYQALGCRDIARVDVRMDADLRPHFLEINPLPGINPVTGDIVILAGRTGVSHRALIAAIVASAGERVDRCRSIGPPRG
jgi:D-alanine-D-alanine ligase